MQKTIVAIARRRKLLDDVNLNALLDDSWDTLDISGSDITDSGLTRAARTCPNLHAVDIRYGGIFQLSSSKTLRNFHLHLSKF